MFHWEFLKRTLECKKPLWYTQCTTTYQIGSYICTSSPPRKCVQFGLSIFFLWEGNEIKLQIKTNQYRTVSPIWQLEYNIFSSTKTTLMDVCMYFHSNFSHLIFHQKKLFAIPCVILENLVGSFLLWSWKIALVTFGFCKVQKKSMINLWRITFFYQGNVDNFLLTCCLVLPTLTVHFERSQFGLMNGSWRKIHPKGKW